MKRTVLSLVGSLIVAGTLVGAQSSPSQSPQNPAPQAPPAPQAAAPQAPAPQSSAPSAAAPSQDESDDKTLKGCLVQGSGPTTFVLENAKLATDAADAKGQSYVVEISAPADQVKSIVNTHVQIVGSAESKGAAAGSNDDKKASEKDLPKLTAKRITRLAATCPATGD